MDYYSTNEVLDAIAGQVRDQLSSYVDDVVIFDGTLEDAVRSHLSQPTKASLKTFLFMALSDDTAENVSGAGLPIRTSHAVDFYVIVRSDGRTKYTKDRERLYDVSDALMYSVFDCPNRTTDYTARVAANIFGFRRRGAPADSSLMAHQVRFIFKARTP